MKTALIIAGVVAGLVLLWWLMGTRRDQRDTLPAARATSEVVAAPVALGTEIDAHPGFLYGRVETIDGASFEGRLRWGRVEEAFWGDLFNGVKAENPWAAEVPPEQRPTEHHAFEIFGLELFRRESPLDLGRPFLARFGDLARIEAHGRKVRVTLKSGSVFDLDRMEASDFDDGLRVWEASGSVVDLDSLRIRSVELLPTAWVGPAPSRLHGTVRTAHGDFSGFVQWNREDCVGTDELVGLAADGSEQRLAFGGVRAILRQGSGSLVTLVDGRELELSGTSEVESGNRGVYVEDSRYGRVLISWEVFDRLDLEADLGAASSGPGYDAFPPGSPLVGSVTTRSGRRLTGRLVYDLDESESTETLDAPADGIDYTIPFALVASMELPPGAAEASRRVRVRLLDGEELLLERSGDLGERNAGMLVFVEGAERPEYLAWPDIERVALDHPR